MITSKKLQEYYQLEKIPEYVKHKFFLSASLTFSEAGFIERVIEDIEMIGRTKVSENYKNRVIDKINSSFDETTRKILLDKIKNRSTALAISERDTGQKSLKATHSIFSIKNFIKKLFE